MLRFRILVCLMISLLPSFTYGLSNGTKFPGPRPSIADLYKNAACVVYGKVKEVIPLKTVHHGQQIYSYGAQNILAVETLFKGPTKDKPKYVMVKTMVSSVPSCRFEEGKMVLAFLRKEKGEYTAGAFHSCIVLKGNEIQHYEKALRLLPQILKVKDEAKRNTKLVAWYVDLAVEPVTRNQGSLGLVWQNARSKDKKKGVLSEEQRNRLLDTIVSESPPLASSAGIVNVLNSYPDKRLDRFLLDALKRAHEPGWEDLTRTAFDTLPNRLKLKLSPETEKRIDEWGDLLSEVYYNFDEKKPSPQEKKLLTERYHIVWGSVTFDVYQQCRAAMNDDLKQVDSKAD